MGVLDQMQNCISYKKHKFGKKSNKKQNNLPILSYKSQIIEYVIKYNSLIIIGETACGKSTQIPQILHDHIEQKGLIGCTQPRKVAAITIAQWVASSRNSVLGDLIGYAVRFENVLSNITRIKYMTDGILLREALNDPLFKQYSTIIIDEIHERSLRTDILLSLLKNAQIQRNNGQSKLKLIIMSATMDVDKFSKFFSNCPVLYIEGQRQYPIQIFNPAEDVSKFNQEDYINNSLITLLKIFRTSTYGDVLVFLPGKDEIDSFIKLGRKLVKDFENKSNRGGSKAEEQCLAKIMFYPFYAGLSKTLQDEVFTTQNNKLMFNKSTNMNGNINFNISPIRKCIVATNIAETSITIPNIRYIIDSGRFKTKTMVNLSPQNTNTLQYNYLRECLIVDWISQDQAWQRTGRAGRDIKSHHQNNKMKTEFDTFISHCYRLYFENNAQVKGRIHIIPEIERVDLSVIIPNLLAIGQKLLIDDSEHKIKLLRFVDEPPRAHIYHAIEKLRSHNIITLNKLKLQMNQKSSINTLQCFTFYVNLLEQEMANFTNSKASNFYNNNKDINGGVCKKRKKFRPFLAPSLFTSLFMPCPYTCDGGPLLSLTPLGSLINLFPLNPVLALLLVKSLRSVNFTAQNYQLPNGHNEAFNNDVPQTKCSEEMCSIVALLSSLTSESGNSSIFLSNTASASHDTSIHNAKNKSHIMPRNLVDYHSDHITMLNVYRAFKSYKANAKWCSTMKLNRKALMLAYRIEKQLKKIIKSNNLGPLQSCGLHMDPVKRILYEGLCQDIAIRQGTSNRYILVTSNFSQNTSAINDKQFYNNDFEKNEFKNHYLPKFNHNHNGEDTPFNERHNSNNNNNPFLYLHPHSVCFANKPKCVVFSELLCTSRPYMKLVTAIDPEWLNN